jgi:hypothetical protein
MAASLSDIVAALQNGVSAVNRLARQIARTFPGAGATVTSSAPGVGDITFDSSLAVGFLAVTTSSGAVAYVALYPSS